MKNRRFFLSFLVLATLMASTFNAQAQRFSPQAKGAVIGGGSGAILGAVINKRNRAVGGVVGGVVGAGAGYAVGKHVDNRNKKRAAAAYAAQRAAANRAAAERQALARRTTTRETIVRSSSPAAVGTTALVASAAAVSASAPATEAGYLPNQAPGDPANPYGSTAYRQRSW
ncbi:glycine zipper 2TM domain-containing protein [Hymenobacter sp. H14-R3]|uniref:YMGG-like glycine zipper-containing protein n=1 Tax=Hymenobacter sp. H14-R3 TaxID=3046308 RepID=UPI0024B9FF4D|nr:YMGG-like glycine zipper-containing protein [Hymenobacter sp. H14-R3]MDJ0364821.1 glycine zipper 2TM domain-containing protein [Hymenobacter sp. H14-R3]